MRILAAVIFAGLLTTPARADSQENCAIAWQNMPVPDRGAMTHSEWWRKCTKASYTVGEENAPSYTIAICKDGHFSGQKKAAHRCAHHGGVETYL